MLILVYDGLFRRDQNGEYVLDENGQRIALVGTQARQVLLLLLEYAADRGYRRDGLNPLAGTKRPVHIRSKSLEQTRTDEEWDELMEMARVAALRPRAAKHLNRTLATTCYTGARIGGSVGLTREKVDLIEPPTLLVNKQLPESYRVTDKDPLEDTKCSDVRMVIAAPALAEILTEALESSKSTDPTDPLFPTKNGTFPTHANVRPCSAISSMGLTWHGFIPTRYAGPNSRTPPGCSDWTRPPTWAVTTLSGSRRSTTPSSRTSSFLDPWALFAGASGEDSRGDSYD